ncbi:MAG: hypothetical protein BWK79_10825 [Beggiatoa sp. IS2]|nr:MAG: hypothetical protein BWK79_10825 [Beggiatoa sp. IS2]
MKLRKSILITFLFSLNSLAIAADTIPETELATYRAIVSELGETLKSELLKALQAGGPAAALATCNEKAIPVTTTIAEKHGLKVGRTSLKLRNPKNAPDEWETKVLKNFVERQVQGKNLSKMEFYEVFEKDGKKQVRYMKAIPVAEPCLTCHGTEIVPEISAKLKTLYPEDKATGFKLGDLRGAFTLIK